MFVFNARYNIVQSAEHIPWVINIAAYTFSRGGGCVLSEECLCLKNSSNILQKPRNALVELKWSGDCLTEEVH